MKGRFIIVLILVYANAAFAQNGAELSVREYEDYILTHQLVPAGPIPTAFDPNGVYPYVSYSETSNRPVPKK